MTQAATSDLWCYRETAFSHDEAAYKESLFAVGNGYLGIRGYFDEGYPAGTLKTSAACFLNGVYESLPIEYDESAYGFAKNCHRIVPVPHHHFEIEIDDVPVTFSTGHISQYQRELNFQNGNYRRSFIWRSASGKEISLCYERSTSYSDESSARFQLSICPLNFTGTVKIRSVLDSTNGSINDIDDPRKGGTVPAENWIRQDEQHRDSGSFYHYQTRNSKINVVAYLTSTCEQNAVAAKHDDHRTFHCVTAMAAQGKEILFNSAVSYVDSRKHELSQLLTIAKEKSNTALASSYPAFIEQQHNKLSEFWNYADIQIESEDGAQYATRFSLFHLFQSTGRDGLSSISAKGLTGAGYDGHYFWDSETYIFPFWLFSQPDVAKNLLEYRVNTLGSAKKRAREMGHDKGALFAWRTIGGEECSSYFPAGTAQYHINADIAYAARSYFLATDDIEFLQQGLAELVLETARIWLDLGHIANDGTFKIFAVTGPDEYTAVVNNNFYTNKMVQTHLLWASDLVEHLNRETPEFFTQLKTDIALTDSEVSQWRQVAKKMFLPFDEKKQIFAQDDSFLDKPVWDFLNTPKEKYPLLLHFHPLVIYRHQVLKQADTLLALLLAPDEIDLTIKRNSFDYYEPINTHDSTLSTCVHGVIANEVGYTDKAYEYYQTTLHLDLEDSHHNTYYGVHTAAMGGIWMGAIQGFAGLRYANGELSFKPALPKQWQSLSFKLRYKGCVVEINLNKSGSLFRLLEGESITLRCHDKAYSVTAEKDLMVFEQ